MQARAEGSWLGTAATTPRHREEPSAAGELQGEERRGRETTTGNVNSRARPVSREPSREPRARSLFESLFGSKKSTTKLDVADDLPTPADADPPQVSPDSPNKVNVRLPISRPPSSSLCAYIVEFESILVTQPCDGGMRLMISYV